MARHGISKPLRQLGCATVQNCSQNVCIEVLEVDSLNVRNNKGIHTESSKELLPCMGCQLP
eukprot:scaffold406086_cov51-Prasinocladus_malaysianus.AAC.1